MRGVASIRTETHLRRFLHGIRLFCNAHSPPKALSPQNLFLSQKHAPIFQSTLLPLPIRAFVALFRCAQYGLLSPYFAALNTGSCYAIAPTRGQCAPPLRLCARAMPLRAYAYASRPYCRCQYGLLSPYFAALNTGFHRPISLRSIRALATLLPLAGQCAPPLRLCARRSAACAHTPTQPARIAVGNTGQSNTIHPIHIKMII